MDRIPKYDMAVNLLNQYAKGREREHGLCVAQYVGEMCDERGYSVEQKDFYMALGVMHDLIEDCDCSINIIDEYFGHELAEALIAITKDKHESYDDYMKRVFKNHHAEFVKRADMKDHLMRLETLTPKLLEKYKPYIGRLMA